MSWKKRRHNKTGRSEGEPDNWVMLWHWLLDSEAWLDLNCFARAALIVLYRIYNGKNNGDVGLAVRKLATNLKVSTGTAQKALKDLVAHGFIAVEQESSFDWKTVHTANPTGRSTRWRLTEFPRKGHDGMPSKEFMRWRPGMSFGEPKKQNAVSPRERNVSPPERSVSPRERTPLENPQSVSPGETVQADSPPKVSHQVNVYSTTRGSAAKHSAPPSEKTSSSKHRQLPSMTKTTRHSEKKSKMGQRALSSKLSKTASHPKSSRASKRKATRRPKKGR